MTIQYITLLGSTGSIGASTLDVIRLHPDRYRVFALCAHSQADKLFDQCREFQPVYAVLGDAEQVHACQYQGEKVAIQSGSIDARPVQQSIINIMEGGREAFNRRKEVYKLWKPQS